MILSNAFEISFCTMTIPLKKNIDGYIMMSPITLYCEEIEIEREKDMANEILIIIMKQKRNTKKKRYKYL